MRETKSAAPALQYKRVILKLSGEVLRGGKTGDPIDSDTLFQVCSQVREIHQLGNTPKGWDLILQSANPAYTEVDLATARKANPSYFPNTVTALDLRCPADKMLALGSLTKPLDIKGLLYKQYRG